MRAHREHPLIIRLTHWLNVVALYIMITSGFRIYNASPLFGFTFPLWMTTGGWLEGARQWHFFAMWIFGANGVIWLLFNLLSRHGRTTTLFRKRDISGVLPMIQYYLRLRKQQPASGKYNPLQKLAYTTVIVLAIGIVLTGIAIYWPVQFSWVTAIFGDYDSARVWHFLFMSSLLLFFFGHVFMVLNAGWKNFLGMITGGKKSFRDSLVNESQR